MNRKEVIHLIRDIGTGKETGHLFVEKLKRGYDAIILRKDQLDHNKYAHFKYECSRMSLEWAGDLLILRLAALKYKENKNGCSNND